MMIMNDYKRLTDRSDPFKWNNPETGAQELIFSRTATPAERALLARLTELENKIEDGLLIELPCKLGSRIYGITAELPYKESRLRYAYKESTLLDITYDGKKFGYYLNGGEWNECEKDWFVTKEQAEARIKELRGKEE